MMDGTVDGLAAMERIGTEGAVVREVAMVPLSAVGSSWAMPVAGRELGGKKLVHVGGSKVGVGRYRWRCRGWINKNTGSTNCQCGNSTSF